MKKMVLFFCVLVMAGSMLFSQTYVAPGDGTLHAAIEAAVDGEVLQLVPGAEYSESGWGEFGIITGKSITIEVEEGSTERAIVKMQTEREEDETIVFFYVGDQGSLTLRGLELDGALDGIATPNYLVTFDMGEFPVPILVKKVQIENCLIHNLMEDVIAAGNADMKFNVVVDSVFIDNTIITKTATTLYFKYAGANYLSMTNSTIYDINSYGVRVAGPVESGLPDNTPKVLIDHTTWYKIGVGDDAREILQGEKGPLLNPWTVTNSIFVNQINKTRTFINIKDNPGPGEENDNLSTITNICWWDIGNVNFRGHTVSDTICMYPGFADTTNGDFTLPAGSPLFPFGSDGYPIGDPRWSVGVYGVEDEDGPIIKSFALKQNYPNPFNPTTTISFNLEKSGLTTLAVYDLMGKEVAVIVENNLKVGNHQFNFDASDLSSGIYFYRLTSSGRTLTKKMMFIE